MNEQQEIHDDQHRVLKRRLQALESRIGELDAGAARPQWYYPLFLFFFPALIILLGAILYFAGGVRIAQERIADALERMERRVE